MDLQPLSARIIDPSIRAYLELTEDEGLCKLGYWSTITNAQLITDAIRTWENMKLPNPGTNAPTEYMARVAAAIDENVSVTEVADVWRILDAYKEVGIRMFRRQVQLLSMSSSSFTDEQTAFIDAVVPKIFGGELDAAIKASVTASEPGDMASWMTQCQNVINQRVQTAIPDATTREWIFPQALRDFIGKVALKPWLCMKYFSAFSDGTFKKRASYYDGRFGHVAILTLFGKGLTEIADRFTNGNADLIARFRKMVATVSIMRKAEEDGIAGDDAINTMYNKVAYLSDRTKTQSQLVDYKNVRLSERKADAKALLANSVSARKRMEKERRLMWTWIAALLVTLLTSVYLLISDKHALFLMQAGVVTTVLTLYFLIRFVRWLRRSGERS